MEITLQGCETLGRENQGPRNRHIREYFKEIEEILSKCPLAIDLKFDFTVVDVDRGFWKGMIRFKEGSELHLFEYAIIAEKSTKVQSYRYHFQDDGENLIFRYDNAPHHSEIKTHPHHLHEPDGIHSTKHPELEDVFDKAMEFVISSPSKKYG